MEDEVGHGHRDELLRLDITMFNLCSANANDVKIYTLGNLSGYCLILVLEDELQGTSGEGMQFTDGSFEEALIRKVDQLHIVHEEYE